MSSEIEGTVEQLGYSGEIPFDLYWKCSICGEGEVLHIPAHQYYTLDMVHVSCLEPKKKRG